MCIISLFFAVVQDNEDDDIKTNCIYYCVQLFPVVLPMRNSIFRISSNRPPCGIIAANLTNTCAPIRPLKLISIDMFRKNLLWCKLYIQTEVFSHLSE